MGIGVKLWVNNKYFTSIKRQWTDPLHMHIIFQKYSNVINLNRASTY